MTLQTITNHIRRIRSFLCVGLDSMEVSFEYNKKVVDATAPYCVAYKPNVAFYEADGWQGWKVLEDTAAYIKDRYPDHFLIADAKRGDIGNTARQYAKAFFRRMPFDAVTIAPYMGLDSVAPFLEFDGKWVILLALTSNPSATDFETLPLVTSSEQLLYQKVLEKANSWAGPDRMMYVVGATQASALQSVRKLSPHYFLLVPGVGAQGGSVQEVVQNGRNTEEGLLINVSRGILQAPQGFEAAAKGYAQEFAKYF